MKTHRRLCNFGFVSEIVSNEPETQEEMEGVMAQLGRRPDLSTYEKHLTNSLREWRECAELRRNTLEANLAANTERCVSHVLMENYFMACECVMAYEKALGVEEPKYGQSKGLVVPVRVPRTVVDSPRRSRGARLLSLLWRHCTRFAGNA